MQELNHPYKPDRVEVVADLAHLYIAAVHELSACAGAAIRDHGRFTLALSGGNTPRAVYSRWAQECGDSLPWNKVYIFFGDERHVPPDHPDSNYRMARESLLSRVPIPEQNVFRIATELDAQEAARRYETSLREFFRLKDGEWPRFDLVLLGLGEDGHTASLFPGTLALNETSRLVVANHVDQLQTDRITLTFPVLNHAAEVLCLVAGESKAAIVRQIFSLSDTVTYPIQRVRPEHGQVVWFIDQDAARLL